MPTNYYLAFSEVRICVINITAMSKGQVGRQKNRSGGGFRELVYMLEVLEGF
jgi:hypothetical protein